MTLKLKTKTFSINPVNPDSKLFTGNILQKQATLIILGGNYARSSRVFESGFSGFSGLTITSPVWVGSLLLYTAFIAKPLADVLHIGEKKGKK
jgi:hypothetical protein